jgi:hypothetical protein
VEQHDLLITAAQVALGLAGFTGIASVFAKPGSEPDEYLQHLRLVGLLENSLLAVAFSLLPLVLSAAGVAETHRWQLVSVAFLITWLSQFARSYGRAFRVLRASKRPVANRGTIAVVALIAVGNGLLAIGALGLATPTSCYIIAVYVQLVLSGLLFYRYFVVASAA